jgi:flagellar basal body-associated protein FliL
MDYEKSGMLQVVAICVAVVLVVAAIAAGFVYGIKVSKEGEAATVESCVSNGGSWVAGPSGFECVQEGLR